MKNTTVNLNDLEVKFIIDAFINKGVNASNVKPEVIKSLNDKNLILTLNSKTPNKMCFEVTAEGAQVITYIQRSLN
tara:strand:+ start:691 stop:918 length:228 start_codon:yes stop_codon:yes gene_type:complete